MKKALQNSTSKSALDVNETSLDRTEGKEPTLDKFVKNKVNKEKAPNFRANSSIMSDSKNKTNYSDSKNSSENKKAAFSSEHKDSISSNAA